MVRKIATLLVVTALAGCSTVVEDAEDTFAPLGDFRLGHNIAIADNVVRGPFSRDFTELQLEKAVQDAVAARLRRYDGDGLYHLGIVVGGMVLAQPGIPSVYAPSSVMIVDVTIFDNSTQSKLNQEPKRFQVGEGLRNAVPVFGTGMVREADQQLAFLAENLAAQIEEWLQENPEWFIAKPDRPRVPFTVQTPVPDIDEARPADPVN